MQNLRKIISQLILESAQDQQDLADHKFKNRRLAYGPYYPKGKRIQLPDKYPETTSYLRGVKRFWNERADHSYFQNDIECVHWINYITGHKSAKRTFLEALKRILYGEPEIKPGDISKNEFSTIGFEGEISGPMCGKVGILISKKRRVTFAAVVDAWTEFNFGTSKELYRYYAGSGLPKRPHRNINPNGVIFDKEDFDKFGVNYFKEITVDNWTWDTLIIRRDLQRDPQIVELIDYVKNVWNKKKTEHIINIEFFTP